MPRYEIVRLDDIEVPQYLPHIRAFRQYHVEKLVSDIMKYGIQVPLRLKQTPDGQLWLVDGYTRYLAALEIGEEYVPALIYEVDKLTDDTAIFESIRINIMQAGMGVISRLKIVEYLHHELDYTIKKACEIIGHSEQWWRKYKRLLDLPTDIQRKVEYGELSAREALGEEEPKFERSPLPSSGEKAKMRPSGERLTVGRALHLVAWGWENLTPRGRRAVLHFLVDKCTEEMAIAVGATCIVTGMRGMDESSLARRLYEHFLKSSLHYFVKRDPDDIRECLIGFIAYAGDDHGRWKKKELMKRLYPHKRLDEFEEEVNA